jgi:hypothetical protein
MFPIYQLYNSITQMKFNTMHECYIIRNWLYDMYVLLILIPDFETLKLLNIKCLFLGIISGSNSDFNVIMLVIIKKICCSCVSFFQYIHESKLNFVS